MCDILTSPTIPVPCHIEINVHTSLKCTHARGMAPSIPTRILQRVPVRSKDDAASLRLRAPSLNYFSTTALLSEQSACQDCQG